MNKNGLFTTKKLVVSAACIALASVLSFVKIYRFPFGGSVTAFSMLFVCIPGIMYGLPVGLFSGLVYGLIQLSIDPYIVSPLQFIVDALLAFSSLGLAGIFYKNKESFSLGYITGVLGRYVFAVISGYAFFSEYAWEGWAALPYSLCYNGAYIFTEAVITLVIINIPALKKALNNLKLQA